MPSGKKHIKYYKSVTSYPRELSDREIERLQKEQDSTAKKHGEWHRSDPIHQDLCKGLLKKYSGNTSMGQFARTHRTTVHDFDNIHWELDTMNNPPAQIRREIKRSATGEIGAVERLRRIVGDYISDAKKKKW